jgi:hypothetical protein
METREQFIQDVLFNEEYYNDNILGKYFSKNVIKYQSFKE